LIFPPPLIFPEENLDEFKNRITFSGVVPKTSSHENKFVIISQALDIDEIGNGIVIGASLVQIEVKSESHKTVTVSDEGVDNLVTVDSGPVQILWKESGLGIKWAIVRIGGGGGASVSSRPAVVRQVFEGTDILLIQPLEVDTGDVNDNSVGLTLKEVGDPEMVFVWPHMTSMDYEPLIAGTGITSRDIVVELVRMNGNWFASQTMRWRLKNPRTDLKRVDC